jgi:uncharacterized protein (DUF362 family)
MLRNDRLVALFREIPEYPIPPYSPPILYPEYLFAEAQLDPNNKVYAAVRSLLWQLGFDREHYGTPQWNPLSNLITRKDFVVIKPNLVEHIHPLGYTMECMITHASVIRPIIDYVLIATRGEGRIVIADAPMYDADFLKAAEISGLLNLMSFYQDRGINIELVDLREERVQLDSNGNLLYREPGHGDPLGYTVFNLGQDSEFAEVGTFNDRLNSTPYDPEEVHHAHNQEHHHYLIANSILKADAIIFVPKMKTHHKSGVTLGLKNAISISPKKQWLPHHGDGSVEDGGDEYPYRNAIRSLEFGILTNIVKHLKRLPDPLKDPALKVTGPLRAVWEYFIKGITPDGYEKYAKSRIVRGEWSGNDTVWRLVLDLNKVLFYGGSDGFMHPEIQRKCFYIIDGVIAGEGKGPLQPDPKWAGILLAGLNPVALDIVGSLFMRIDFTRLQHINKAIHMKKYPLANACPQEILVVEDPAHPRPLIAFFSSPENSLQFRLPLGWDGHEK